MSNVGRAIVKKLAVKFEGNEILDVDDFDMIACYRDLWKIESEKWNTVRQGIIHSGGCTLNCMQLQINARNKNASNTQHAATANAYRNKFIIPLHFEMLDSVMPCYKLGLRNRLCYEIAFSNYDPISPPGVRGMPSSGALSVLSCLPKGSISTSAIFSCV